MASPSEVIFTYGNMWKDSVANAVKDSPNILQKINEFRQVKLADPLALFGTSDKSFSSDGIYKQYLPKARKAHLNRDISIIYELSGKNPTYIKIYGVFTHSMLGMDQTPNIKLQKNMAKRLSVSENKT